MTTLKPPTQPQRQTTARPQALEMDVRRPMNALIDEVAKVIVGKRHILELVAAASITEGAHILFEDLPGLGKSVMAAAFANASGTTFKRVQFTPDLLPSDITGTYVLDQKAGTFQFHKGPIFTNFLLADEINRAGPKTQSALLEAMAEKQVSVEGTTHKLDKPFLVMATQNPIEQEGTYPLPEAQLDRFMIKTSVGQPNVDEEEQILLRRNVRMKDDFDIKPATTAQQLVQIQKTVEKVHVDAGLVRYVAEIICATRSHTEIRVGASPRGSLALMKLAKAHAAMQNRAFVVPDDIRQLVEPVLGHRIILKPEARIQGTTAGNVLGEILKNVPVPKA